MQTEILGGNCIKQFKINSKGKEILSSGPYEYFIYETEANEILNLEHLCSFTLYIFHKPAEAIITVQGLKEELQQGDRLQAENCSVQLKVSGGNVKLLIAGTIFPHPQSNGLFFAKATDIYKIEKPWGYELWLNQEHPCYAFKKIFIKAGTKASLQYHKLKQETIVLFEGTAKLHYKKNSSVDNDLVTSADIETTLLQPISLVDIVPFTLHRFEAVTDILLFETSTPHLDDIMRVQDDNQRSHGRIASEHIQS